MATEYLLGVHVINLKEGDAVADAVTLQVGQTLGGPTNRRLG